MTNPCAYFLQAYVDNYHTYSVAGEGITLYPTLLVHEDNSSVINVKKYIGGVKVDRDNTPPFEGLSALRRGCIVFRANSNASGNANSAVLYDSSGTKVKTYTGKWFCKLLNHHPDGVTPDWKDVPKDCKTWIVWYQDAKVQSRYERVIDVRAESPDSALNKFQEQIRVDLRRKGVPTAAIDKFLTTQKGSGPWFPCAQTGCCRAFD